MTATEPHDPRHDPQLTTSQCRQIDACCAEFERGWREGNPVAIESLLENWTGIGRRALLRELLAIELEHRIALAQTVDEREWHARFPTEGDLVALVLSEAQQSLPVTLPGSAVSGPGEAGPVPDFLRDHPRYRVVRRLGTGGMGEVWLAEHTVLGRPVAVKVIRADLLKQPDARSRFLREAQSAARLNHPNVVTIHDAEASGESPLLVMEYLEGCDLAQLVRDQGPPTVVAACDIIRQAAQGLAAAHAAGLVHRDLSPRNLLQTPEGTVKLLDFGLASIASELPAGREAEAGQLIGSADYMAPEQARNPSLSDIRSDLYSLGCVLYYLLVGEPPYPRGTLAERLRAHASDPVPDLSAASRPVPQRLATLVKHLLAKSPADRIQSPAELVDRLDQAIPRRGNDPSRKTDESPARRPTRRGFLITSGSLLAAALLGLAWRPWQRAGAARRKSDPVERVLQESRLLLAQRQESQVRTAVARLERLLEQQPESAAGHALLAEAWNLLGDYGWEPAADCFPRAIASAERALQFDSDLAEAHLALAFAWHGYECDWDRAEQEYQRAIELDDRSSAAHHWYAWLLVQRRRFAEARAEVELAHELEPVDLIVMNNVGKIAYYRREFTEAARWHRETLLMDPDFRKAHLDLGYTLIELHDTEAALDQLDKAIGLSTGQDDILAARAYALARGGDFERARGLVAELEPGAETQRMALEMARIYVALNLPDDAFRWLDQAFRQKSPGRGNLAVDPRWDPLRSDPRFQELERRVFPSAP